MCNQFVVYCCAVLLGALSVNGARFRADYEYSSDVKGWLKLHPVRETWDQAFLRCEAEGADVASPLDLKFENAMRSMMRRLKVDSNVIYTGIRTRLASVGQFTSVEGVPLTKMPNLKNHDIPKGKGCITMSGKDTYGLSNCTDKLPFMCYKKNRNEPVTECGTIDKEYVLRRELGSCYKYHRFMQDWSGAEATCRAEGGHLLVINSEAEAQAIRELMPTNTSTTEIHSANYVAAVGVYEWPDYGLWYTVTGQPLEEAGYNTGLVCKHPPCIARSTASYYRCAGIRTTAQLVHYYCSYETPFFCELKVAV